MLFLKAPLYPGGARVASVARLAILSPDLPNLANFGTPPPNFIFNFFVLSFSPTLPVLASIGLLLLTRFKPNLAKFGP